jgi:ankyrin repeat protein
MSQGGHTPLHLASKYGHTQLMQLLLQHGAGVIAANRIYKMTPLHMAAKEGQRGSAEALVQAGADVNAAAKVGAANVHTPITCRGCCVHSLHIRVWQAVLAERCCAACALLAVCAAVLRCQLAADAANALRQ